MPICPPHGATHHPMDKPRPLLVVHPAATPPPGTASAPPRSHFRVVRIAPHLRRRAPSPPLTHGAEADDIRHRALLHPRSSSSATPPAPSPLEAAPSPPRSPPRPLRTALPPLPHRRAARNAPRRSRRSRRAVKIHSRRRPVPRPHQPSSPRRGAPIFAATPPSSPTRRIDALGRHHRYAPLPPNHPHRGARSPPHPPNRPRISQHPPTRVSSLPNRPHAHVSAPPSSPTSSRRRRAHPRRLTNRRRRRRSSSATTDALRAAAAHTDALRAPTTPPTPNPSPPRPSSVDHPLRAHSGDFF